MVANHRSKQLPRVILARDLGVVRQHRRQRTALGMTGSHVRRAGAEAKFPVQRHSAAIIQDGELVHVEVHAPVVLALQFYPRAQANDGDTHTANDNATSPQALHVDPPRAPALTDTYQEP